MLFAIFVVWLTTIGMNSIEAQDCDGAELNAFSYTKTFSSPGYPANYPNNLNCNWVIAASPGHTVKITFNPFNTESCCDYVQIYDGSTSIGQYRGPKHNLVIVSKTGTLRVNLRSDDSINGLGFSASYKEEDLDECSTGNDNCDGNANCHNSDGSFTCSCKRGFNGNGTHCSEINECNDAIHPPNCHANAYCVDHVDEYECKCNDGYTGDGIQCSDIDECQLELTECNQHATCSNRDGGFICKCNEGFEGDGYTCEDLDECALKKHECSFDSACNNSPGGYSCTCPTGFSGNGYQCSDVNECKVQPSICGENARCVNSDGDYNCVCADGYAGDGKICHKAFEVLCLPGSISVRVMKQYYTEKGVFLDELHLSDFSCKGQIDPTNPNVWVFNLTTLSSCSTIHKNNATHLMYTNTISNVVGSSHVYVGSALMNTFSCTYKRMLDDLNLFSFNYGVYQNVANISAGSSLGVFIAKMNHFTDSTYSVLDTNQDYKTSDSIFVKIELETSDPGLNLVLERCWITPSPNIKQRKFNFIERGCAVNNSAQIEVTQSGKGPIALFHSQVFAFVDYNTTFLHCSLLICPSASGKSCEPKCVDGLNSNKYSQVGDNMNVEALTSLLRSRRSSGEEYNQEEILSMGPFRRMKDPSLFNQPLFLFFLAAIVLLLVICFTLLAFLIRQNRK